MADTITEAVQAIMDARPRTRYRKLLGMPDWTDTELGRLDGRLQQYVISSLVKRDRVQKRVNY